MKKLTKLVTACSLGTLMIMSTSCNLLFQAAKKIAEYEPGQVQYTDDHTSLEITKPGLYKIEKFHVDVSELAKNYPESQLYTYQINKGTSSIKAEKMGYISKITKSNTYDYSGAGDDQYYINYVSNNPGELLNNNDLPKIYVNGGTNLIPEAAADMYRNPEKYLNTASGRSRAAGEETFETRNFERYSNGKIKDQKFYVGSGTNVVLEGESKVAEYMCEGQHCIVFRAKNETFVDTIYGEKNGQKIEAITKGGKVSMTSAQNLANRFDDIYSKVTGIMGTTDTTSSPYTAGFLKDDYDKIVIFIHDISGDHRADYGVVGYFYGGDLLEGDYTNRCRMINVDSYFLQYDTAVDSKGCESTLAHEFTHMCNFINKAILIQNGGNISWFTEMMAMTCEDILRSEIEPMGTASSIFSRLSYFNYGYSLGFNNWNNDYTNAAMTLVTYANTYTMGAFFLRNFAAPGERIKFINQIATNKKTGMDAIGFALLDNKYITGSYDSYTEVFKKAYDYFPQVLINAGDADEATLFISGTEKYNGNSYKIEAIDLTKYSLKVSEDYTQVGPLKLQATENSEGKYTTQVLDLGSYGFDFHEYGSVKNMETIDIEREKNRNIEFFIYIK